MAKVNFPAIIISGVIGVFIFFKASSQSPMPFVTAQKATDFLNSIGVNSSISKRGETLEQTAQALKYTGIRWIRTGYEGDIPVTDIISLHKMAGTKVSYGLLSGGTDIQRLLASGRQLAANNCLLAFEGPNEPNNWGLAYNGIQGGRNATWMPIANLQKDLYSAVKADALLKNFAVWSLSENGAEADNVGLQYLTIPTGSGADMPAGTKFADYANCHNYITHPAWPGLHDNQTWIAASPGTDCRVDGLYGNYGRTWNKKLTGYTMEELQTLPRVTTETGVTIDSSVTEQQHAQLILNMFLAQFKRGWSYTAVYLLRDRNDEQGNQQFGFYTTAYAPRKAATYLHNLTTILADKEALATPGGLQYVIINQPATVHDLLLQKSNGSFCLIVWGEKIKGADNVEIKFANQQRNVAVYNVAGGTLPEHSYKNADNVYLSIGHAAFIIEIPKS